MWKNWDSCEKKIIVYGYIVSKEEFKKRKKTNYSYMTFSDTHETNQSFECGCREDHFIGRDGVKLAKQVDQCEFVINCAKEFKTLIENSFELRQQFSIIGKKVF